MLLDDTDLRDPAPPASGRRRARRGRLPRPADQAQPAPHRRPAGALGVVAVLSLGVVALGGGGSSNPSTTQVQVGRHRGHAATSPRHHGRADSA